MSYFMTMAGAWVDLSPLLPIKLIPIDQTQPYLQQREELLSREDGQPLFLVHDGETGTSHNFITAAEEYFNTHDRLEGTPLFELFKLFCDEEHVFRIWWASDNKKSEYRQCSTLEEVTTVVKQQIVSWSDIQLRYAAVHLPSKQAESE